MESLANISFDFHIDACGAQYKLDLFFVLFSILNSAQRAKTLMHTKRTGEVCYIPRVLRMGRNIPCLGKKNFFSVLKNNYGAKWEFEIFFNSYIINGAQRETGVNCWE